MEEFLLKCEQNNGPISGGGIGPRCLATRDATRSEVISALESGKELRYSPEDWYSQCRYEPSKEEEEEEDEVIYVMCRCGHSVPSGLVLTTSSGTSCSQCYDRMSQD